MTDASACFPCARPRRTAAAAGIRGRRILGPALAAVLAVMSLAVPPAASPVPADPQPDCEALAEREARALGIPPGLLTAIARVESGRGTGNGQVRAWPWTFNQGGDGGHAPTREAALARIDALVASGVTNVDIGCMQLNWRWHGAAFGGTRAMIAPDANVRYAARFLRELKDRHGTWDAAVAAYHSADTVRGPAYAAKVVAAMQAAGAVPPGAARDDRAAPLAPAPGARPPATRGLLVLSGGAILSRGAGPSPLAGGVFPGQR
ncbi:lytic transglycosylase domain-containing protein [Frigidibacter oleivorans]|uniref:lytic transglycosylase domain-containing protein n=1 Tax=Frigidibacter oleivorans TaxID=2487129 RepID=UPI000F8DCDA1|nr:lytic transglycosylase domain-containing protein [Frigidibacter oleivorans]